MRQTRARGCSVTFVLRAIEGLRGPRRRRARSSRIAGVLEDADLVTGGGHGVEAQDLDLDQGGARLRLGLAVLAHRSERCFAGDFPTGAARHQDLATGPRPRSSLASMMLLDAERIGIGLELEDVGLEQDGPEEASSMPMCCLADTFTNMFWPIPLLGDDAVLGVSIWRTRSGLAYRAYRTC